MPAFIIGEKSKTSQVYTDKGERVPVTFIKTSPCYLVGIKWPKKHGYMALKFGFGNTKNINKPQLGELQKAGIKTPLRFFAEFRLVPSNPGLEENNKMIQLGDVKLQVGDEIKPPIFFKKGDMLTVTGVTKGKGFQGVVKRHGFAGGPRTHGQSDRERAPGAIGQTTTPGRIFRGKRMAGRMGQETVTIKNLEVIEVRDDGVLIKGLVPGPTKGFIRVRTS